MAPRVRKCYVLFYADVRLHNPMTLQNVRVKDASEFGADCYQAPWYSRLAGIGGNKMAEGCLYLNVYAPNGTSVHAPPQPDGSNLSSSSSSSIRESDKDKATSEEASPPNALRSTTLPVLVWFHGGYVDVPIILLSFLFGSSSREPVDGDPPLPILLRILC